MLPVEGTAEPLERWLADVGELLKTALSEMRNWSLEGGRTNPRSIGRLELVARTDGNLEFDGTGYILEDGLAHVIAHLAQSFETEPNTDAGQSDQARSSIVLGSTIAFDLARQIADLNEKAGYPVHEDIRPFGTKVSNALQRPKGRGEDSESRILRNRLMAWAIQRGVDLGLKPSKNRASARNPHSNKPPCAADLVVEIFKTAGCVSVTYNMVLSAYRDLHYGGSTREDQHKFRQENPNPNQRRLLQSTNLKAVEHQFDQLDDILPRLQEKVRQALD